jgi:hypothetical protein
MKKLVLATIFLIVLSGCSTNNSNPIEDKKDNKEVEQTNPKVITKLTKEDALSILGKAEELEFKFYQKEYTTQEVYDYYSPYFTQNYVDNIVFKKGNVKLENDKWVIANKDSELVEGSFFNIPPNEASVLEKTDNEKVYLLRNNVGEGLYAPHTETITFLHTDKGWKIDNLSWEPTK